jgi:hypothetical protein
MTLKTFYGTYDGNIHAVTGQNVLQQAEGKINIYCYFFIFVLE